MTHNQIEYWKLKETERSNRAQERLIEPQAQSYLANANLSNVNAERERAYLLLGKPVAEVSKIEAETANQRALSTYNTLSAGVRGQELAANIPRAEASKLQSETSLNVAKVGNTLTDSMLKRQQTSTSKADQKLKEKQANLASQQTNQTWYNTMFNAATNVRDALMEPAKGVGKVFSYLLNFSKEYSN